MDRRQRKTREAIFGAFTELLSEKSVNQITVGEIIERADVGRATFYAHFETKDYLLKELCEELFCHVFDAVDENPHGHKHIFDCDDPVDVFLHLFLHLQKNDNHILDLFSSRTGEMFSNYFKNGLILLIEKQYGLFEKGKAESLPKEFWINHIANTFVETARFWVKNKMRETPETITRYFFLSLHCQCEA